MAHDSKTDEPVRIISKSGVNAFLLVDGEELSLVDTGGPGTEGAILEAVEATGRNRSSLRHIVLTHAHPDHIGSAAALARATGAKVYIHALDRAIAEQGGRFRKMRPAPGLMLGVLFRFLSPKPDARVDPVRIDATIADGDVLPIAGGLEVIHVPGHCAGQVALFWQRHRILFTADACTNLMGLGDPLGFEDASVGGLSQLRLAGLSFDAAYFGHGKAITNNASQRFRKKWLPA